MTIRILKCVMVLSVGAWSLLIAWGNLADYDANRLFVQHVLSMDTVFPDNPLRYRAITDPTWQAVAYGAIIATEWAMGLLCVAGACRLLLACREPAAFAAAKAVAACGLTLAFVLYLVGFIAIGGEWFCSWQSAVWNGQPKAAMFLACVMFTLLALLLREEDASPARELIRTPGGR